MNNASDMTNRDIGAWIADQAANAQLASDSRRIRAGDVFFAYPGAAGDGRCFIAAAIAQGAGAIVHEACDFIWDPKWMLPHLAVTNLKNNAGPIAHAFYALPAATLFSIGITGTNGKTSCALWLGQALARLGQPTAVIGTLGVALFKTHAKAQFDVTGYTTPDAVLLARKLAEARAAGAAALAIEVSSIGLDQNRLDGMHFDVALLTNLTRDHLDYHGDLVAYEAAKTKLFDWPGLKTAIVNLDDPMGLRLIAHLQHQQAAGAPALMGYTLADVAAQPEIEGVTILRASDLRSLATGTDFHLTCRFGSALVKTGLIGHFNISNVLGVMAALLARGIAWSAALAALEALTPAPGRMQQVGGADAPMVVVDYAHTPDALEKTLHTLRQVAQERGGQLWCVFGCGGDRDPGKRAQMGTIAQLAGQVLVTSDNPRSEDPHAIIGQIVAGMDRHHPASVLQVVADRSAAIASAIGQAARRDVILLAGKGHEQYQEIKGSKLPFSDADHAALALAARSTTPMRID